MAPAIRSVDQLGYVVDDFFAMIREVARTWDGESAPIRELDFG
ncbi:hypothetical protein OG948_46750 (plasmid) [Embleya sp. NBC_00888]|nr:hypothetical protein OG948_46750 [Embleya sp. NBC_00888]